MYENKNILHTLLSLVVLSMSFLKLVMITTAIPCDSDLNSSGVSFKSPRTVVGNFMVYQNFNALLLLNPIRDVFIYWREINIKDICGESFEYQVYCTPVTDDITYETPIMRQTLKNYVKFEKLDTMLEYKCKIYFLIDHNLPTEYSIIDIPKEGDRNPKSLSLTRIEYDEEEIFELTWTPQEVPNFQESYNYTLFWCDMDKDRPYECINDLNWVNIPSTETSYNITATAINKNYHFAISLNSKVVQQDEFDIYKQVIYRSSGMILESCTVKSYNWVPGQMFNIDINVIASKYVQMYWTLECSGRVEPIQGYRVLYCPLISQQNAKCIEPVTEKKIYSENQPYDAKILYYGRITVLSLGKLKPLTTYRIIISVLSDNGEGLQSIPLFVTTLKEGDIKSTGLSVMTWPSL